MGENKSSYDSLDRGPTLDNQKESSKGNIDGYELLKELGGGGFGTVYLARDTVAGIDVAVKGLPPLVRLNKEELENVRRNFALVSRLHHPNIAAALHLHKVERAVYVDKADAEKLRVSNGDLLVVMQYAKGVTLSSWRKQFPENKVPLDQALEITRQVASALDYAHREKILHRDIKPANVMIETDAAGKVTARVLDFGLAAEIRSSMGRVSQRVTDTSGTRPYMAPEQWLGREQGRATDQYALAVMFFELVTGNVPFASAFETGDPIVMMNVVGREPPKLPSDLPKPVCLALAKALLKTPEERFSSCAEFVEAIEGKVKVKSLSGEKSQFSKLTAILLAALCVGGGAWYWQDAKAKEQARIDAQAKAERVAQQEAERKAAADKAERERLAKKAEEKRLAKEAEENRNVETKRRDAEQKAELEVFQLSAKAQSAHDLIGQESAEIKEFFASEIRAFENDRRAGGDAKSMSKNVIATNFYAKALFAATALKTMVVKYGECNGLFPEIERAKSSADEVGAADALPGRYKESQNAQNAAIAAFKIKHFDECKRKAQEAKELFASLRIDVITATLNLAEGYKAAERWEMCKKEAEKVLGWDSSNRKALQLKADAEKNLIPSLWCTVKINDRVLTANDGKVKINGKEYSLPFGWKKLEKGQSLNAFAVEYQESGKRYTGKFDNLTVNWVGEKKLAIALTEHKGPRHGDTKTLTLPGGATMEMIYCAPGTFMMGSPVTEDGRFDRETQHRVTLSKGFWLGKYEVTQAQWQSVMGENPSYFKGDMNLPVEFVSWEDCQKFIQRVNAHSNCGARLPTEAEWEYACRAGMTTAYHWGNALNGDKANCDGNYPCGTEVKGPYQEKTTRVGSYDANSWGFYDMHGNVWEWCADWYGAYSEGVETDPTGLASGVGRVLRGGGWYDRARDCRSANRDWGTPGDRYSSYGFRLACSAGPRE